MMTGTHEIPDIKDLLIQLGYQEAIIEDVVDQLETLLEQIEFNKVKRQVDSAIENNYREGLIKCLQDLMVRLEPLGYYRPDTPNQLIKLLVNGLNPRLEDIFAVIDEAPITEAHKSKEKEFLASCAAITQLGYILLSLMVPEVKSASVGSHVFLIIDTLSPALFVDFSLDSVLEVDIQQTYEQKVNYYHLTTTVPETETIQFLSEYYPVFQMAAGVGLSHNIHNNLGLAYDLVGRYPDAIDEFNKALEFDPGYIQVHNNLAVTYYHTGRLEEAILALQQVLESDPGNAEARCNLGIIYAHQDKYEQSVEELNEAIRQRPDYAPAHNNLGSILARQKKEPQAIKAFQEAIRQNPEYTLAHANLGQIYAAAGRYEDAIQEFRAALESDPDNIDVNYDLGMAYYHRGSYEKAVGPLVRAVELDPELLGSVPDQLKLKVSRRITGARGF